VAEVVSADLAIFRCFLAALTSSAYCLDPTLRSSTHGREYLDTKFSSRRYS
jgi:hypothetical protein